MCGVLPLRVIETKSGLMQVIVDDEIKLTFDLYGGGFFLLLLLF